MGWAVVISSNGFGIPVTESELGTTVDVSDNGFGHPVVLVDSGGFPVRGAGDVPPTGYGFLILNGKYLALNGKRLVMETANG